MCDCLGACLNADAVVQRQEELMENLFECKTHA